MTTEQLYEIAFVVAAARTHATDAEYVKEIDPLVTKLIDAVQEAWAKDEAHFRSMEAYRLEVEGCRRQIGDLLDQFAKEQADAHQFAKERDQYQGWMLAANDELAMVRKVLAEANELRVELTKERNDAQRERDEAIRLGDERLATLWDEKKAEIAGLTKERDEARGEVERLRGLITWRIDHCPNATCSQGDACPTCKPLYAATEARR